MRASPALLLLTLALAGCISDEPASDALGTPLDAEAARAAELAKFLKDHPTFCDSETDCDYWDDNYHQYVVYDLDTTVIDVVIVPPAGGDGTDQLAASRQAVQAWSDGIEALGASWFVDNFTMNVYAVGIDIPSIDAIADPEIIVLSTSAEMLVGIGLEPQQIACQLIGQQTIKDFGGHRHGAGSVRAAECTGTGYTCFAINVGDLRTRGLYDLIAHEVGHCLGAGHVGDALDFRARYAPVEDIMSYQDNEEQVHCVSTMNVRNLEGVYAHLLDRPESEFLPRGSYMPFHPLDWATHECENPPGM